MTQSSRQTMLDLINAEVRLSLVGIFMLICSVVGVTWGAHAWISTQFKEAEARGDVMRDGFQEQFRELEKAVNENSSRLKVTNAILTRIERQLGNGALVDYAPRGDQ